MLSRFVHYSYFIIEALLKPLVRLYFNQTNYSIFVFKWTTLICSRDLINSPIFTPSKIDRKFTYLCQKMFRCFHIIVKLVGLWSTKLLLLWRVAALEIIMCLGIVSCSWLFITQEKSLRPQTKLWIGNHSLENLFRSFPKNNLVIRTFPSKG